MTVRRSTIPSEYKPNLISRTNSCLRPSGGLDSQPANSLAYIAIIDILGIDPFEITTSVLGVAVRLVGMCKLIPDPLLFVIGQTFGLERSAIPRQCEVCHSILKKAMAEQVRAMKKSTCPVIGSNNINSVLILLDRFFEQAHFLVCDGELVMGF